MGGTALPAVLLSRERDLEWLQSNAATQLSPAQPQERGRGRDGEGENGADDVAKAQASCSKMTNINSLLMVFL